MKKFLGLAVLAAALGSVSVPASAVIVLGTLTGGSVLTAGGSFVKTNATLTPNIGVNLINGFNIYGLNERQGGTLTNATRFWTTKTLAAGVTDTAIAVGTRVNSHLLFLDAPAGVVVDPITGRDTVTFSTKIIGYRWGQNSLAASNATLGNRFVTYGILRPLETSNDAISFSGRTLTYSLSSPASTSDFVRIITAVPEPTTWGMLMVGFALVGVAARRRPRTVAA